MFRAVVFSNVVALSLALLLCAAIVFSRYISAGAGEMRKGYDVRRSGLEPVYPEGYDCSPLTSLYASWLDVDGTHREEVHTGVDGGRLGEWILAPAPGKVRAVWEADWRWGREGALVLVHTAADLNMKDGAPLYYSIYDHLKWGEIKHLKSGQRVERGEKLARVHRPGGKKEFLPEVHWEVWEAQHDELEWVVNRYGGQEWRNNSARLIDPLYMLGAHSPPSDGRSIKIVPFEKKTDYSDFRGFTYIFRCHKRD